MSLFLAIAGAGQVARLECDFAGTDPARQLPWAKSSVREPGLSTDGWRFGPGVSLVGARDDRLAFSVTGSAEPTTLAHAREREAFLSMRVASSEGVLDLSGNRVRFTIRRESWHAPLQYAVLCSVDGFGTPVFTSPLLDNADDATDTFTFLLPRTGFDSLASPVEFRLYPFAARHTGHAASLTAFSLATASETHILSVSSTRGGTATASPARTEFEEGEMVRIVATPEPGFRFVGWVGAPAGSGNPASLRIFTNTAIIARFAAVLGPRMDLGGNLEGLADWTTAWVFKDCFRLARTWLTRNADGSGEWNSEQVVPSDGDGWPLVVPFDPPGPMPPQRVHTLVPLYGPGIYTVRLRGRGRIELIAPNGGTRHRLEGSGGVTMFCLR